jgi:hypothetical protein
VRARFIFEAAFLLLVALIERASSRETGRAPADEAEEELPLAEEAPDLEPAAAPEEARSWLSRRWRRMPAEAQTSPTAAFEARPSRSHVRRLEPATEPEDGDADHEEAPSAAAEATVSHPPEEAPGPVVTKRPLDLPGLEQPPVTIPAPRPRGALSRAARRVVQPPAPPPKPPPAPPAREWNLWDLERRAREQSGNALRDEEWSALFTHLRVFANTDGVLPKEFDELVRESFGELIEAA